MSVTTQKKNLLYFTFLGLLYLFLIKEILGIPGFDEGFLWFIGLSYYLLIYIILESWTKSVHSYLLSFSLIELFIEKLKFIKFKKVYKFFRFLNNFFFFLVFLMWLGGGPFTVIIFLLYLGVLMVLSLKKREKKENNSTK